MGVRRGDADKPASAACPHNEDAAPHLGISSVNLENNTNLGALLPNQIQSWDLQSWFLPRLGQAVLAVLNEVTLSSWWELTDPHGIESL